MTHYIYKILRMAEWETLQSAGEFRGSVHDERDGFIHFSTKPQLAGTLAKHYTSGENLILAEVNADAADVLADLKYEISRGGDEFPHLYGVLSCGDVIQHWQLKCGPDGQYRLPQLG